MELWGGGGGGGFKMGTEYKFIIAGIKWHPGLPVLLGCPHVDNKDTSYSEEINTLWAWFGCRCY